MKRIALCLCLLAASRVMLPAQEKTVSGRVVSADDNEPVAGATVIIKGSSIGTVTSFDGEFTLQPPAGATTLTVSFIGMVSQEVAIAPSMLIRLATDAQAIDEVVVTALGISREKKALGYAVQDVKSEQLTQGANTSLTGALQGKLSGVDFSPTSGMPGASSKMVIRGSRSFTGNNTPLYVVDGMPVASTSYWGTGDSVTGADNANRSFDIDPNDVESVNILKGQAASALYGMRASNGVVVITTKSGRNAPKGKAQVSFSSSFGVDRIARTPEVQTRYAQGSAGKYAPQGQASWGPLIENLPDDETYGGNNYGFPGRYFVQQIASAYGLTRDDAAAWATPGVYDNINNFFRQGYVWNN